MKELLDNIKDAETLRPIAVGAIDILTKVADYIGAVQPALEAQGTFSARFSDEANKIAAVLADRNVISHAESTKLAQQLADSPLSVFNLIRNVSKAPAEQFATPAQDMGGKVASEQPSLDAFDRLALYGDPNAGVRSTYTGMVD